ncbi:MAG: EpsG family protein, partial [Acutalibacteraceae bacterium]
MNNNNNLAFYLNLAWVVTVLCWALAMFCRSRPINKLGGLGQPLPHPMSLIVPLLLYVPFSGLRNNAGDTYFYIFDFELKEPDGHFDYEFGGGTLYSLLFEIVKETVNDYQVLIFVTAIISLVPVLVVLYKYSHPYDLSIYLFMATGYFGLSMNGVRQYMATGVLMLGTKFLFSTKKSAFFKYAIVVFFAWMIHKSALIMIFVFIFVRRKAWRPSSFMLLFVSIVVVSLFDLLMPSFLSGLEETSFSNYAENGWFTNGEESGSSFIRVIVSMVPIVIAYFSRSRMRQLGHIGDILTNLGFVHIALYIISTYNWIFARFAIYTSVYYIILLAWVVYNGVQKKDRGI